MIEKRVLKRKLKTFFVEKYNNAGGHRISRIQRIDSEDLDSISYSFNLKCSHKREPYSLNFILKLFLGDGGYQKAEEEYSRSKELMKRKIPTQKVYYLIESTELFGHPFIIKKSKMEQFE